MRIVERRNGLVGLLVGLALFCVALPASAQDARLKLSARLGIHCAQHALCGERTPTTA